ncbi:MAG TPA: alginate biosynthesis protein Alg44 [Methylomirabilota bacterium]|nr:alginate biosynthesis protein Alg44 [Methylomirabilota bacterium]
MTAIVHEAFVQRQHTRYKLPLTVVFNGDAYQAADWSVGGVGIQDVDLDIGVGTVHSLHLKFAFDGFTLGVQLRGEIRNVDRQRRRVGFCFVETTMAQVSLIQFVIDAFLAGDIVHGGDILEVSAKDAAASARTAKPGEAETRAARWRRIAASTASWTVITAVFGGLIGFIGSNIYDKMFIVHPVVASITGDVLVLGSESPGRIGSLHGGPAIAAGETAFTVTRPDGTTAEVESPCDCTILAVEAEEGAFVRAGQTVMTLVPPDTPPSVTVALDYADLGRLTSGTVARIQYLDGVEETVSDISFQPALTARGSGFADQRALVRLTPARALDAAAIGQPVNVWFDTSGLPFVR